VAAKTPQTNHKVSIDPATGLGEGEAREVARKIGVPDAALGQAAELLRNLYRCYWDTDASLVEVNPLVVTGDGRVVALDAKLTFDDNALFRHEDVVAMRDLDENALYRQPEIRSLRDISQENPSETHAKEWELSYIALDGNIGCLVNGAGLAMATMDVIKLHGGEPANFLDVGGGATKERVTEAFKIILSDMNVKGILVNIFGGIVRCDLIAEGILGAVQEVGVKVPVVVRLEGNNADLGKKLLNESKLNVIAGEDLTDAAKKIIAAVKKK
jgi:succinyl-CoA synthetase beta subunit